MSDLVSNLNLTDELIHLAKDNSINSLNKINNITSKYGLILSNESLQNLQKERIFSLKKTGRVEFENEILEKLIYAFCDSQYINQSSYEDVLISLQDLFYCYKNECEDELTDDELVFAMCTLFNEVARGDIKFMENIPRETLCIVATTGSIENMEFGNYD